MWEKWRKTKLWNKTRIIERQHIYKKVDQEQIVFFFAFSKENRIMEHKGTVTLPYLCNLPFPFYNCGTASKYISIS